MELELKKEEFTAYQMLPQLCDTHEETTETIVPDYCPDIARIVDASGCLFLNQKEKSEGKILLSGSVRVTLLYIGEGDDVLRSLAYSVPLSYSVEGNFGTSDSVTAVEGRLLNVEARLLNPRKVFTKLEIETVITPYEKAMLTACSDIELQSEYHIETLCEQHDYWLIQGIAQKEFAFSDETAVSGTKEGIKEILRMESCVRVTDCKAVSNKVIVKGVVCLDGLYQNESGSIEKLSAELPFSQVMDGMEDNGKDTFCDCTVSITGAEYKIGSESAPDDNRTLSVKLFLSAFTLLRQEKTVCCISDLYSTSHDLSAEVKSVQLQESPDAITREQSVHLTIETGCEVGAILSTSVRFESTSVTQNASNSTLQTVAVVKVLYTDENSVPLLAERRTEVSMTTDLPQVSRLGVQNVCAGEVNASAGANGIDIRFPAVFTVWAATKPCYPCLVTLKAEKCEETGESLPSLILRALAPNQKLWDLAKQYRTTVSDILQANELVEETAARIGQMLLIPRKR